MSETNTAAAPHTVREFNAQPVVASLTANELLLQLNAAKGWEQRYRLLLSLPQSLTPEATAIALPHYAVQGCEAAVWLQVGHCQGQYYFISHSTSRLVAGLLVVLLAPLQGASAARILHKNTASELNQWLQQCGLERQLTPSRSNGLHQIFTHAQQVIAAHTRL